MQALEGFSVWLSGQGGSDRSALAACLRDDLAARGFDVRLLEGAESASTATQGVAELILLSESPGEVAELITQSGTWPVWVHLGALAEWLRAGPALALPDHEPGARELCVLVIKRLEEMGFLPVQGAYTEEEAQLVEKRLKDLGYM